VKGTIISNEDVARILKEIDFFLRFHGFVHPMKAKRFQQAAHAVSLWPREVMEAIHLHGVTELPHIDGLVDAVIAEILTTGSCTLHQEVCGPYPYSLAELSGIPGLNLKQIFLLYRHAGVRSLADLRKAVGNPQHLLGIPGFGPHSFARMSQAIQ